MKLYSLSSYCPICLFIEVRDLFCGSNYLNRKFAIFNLHL